jgi:hypothetical protein
MAVQEIKCPNCGAPLKYDGGDSSTMQCSYCNSVVTVPEELRPARSSNAEIISALTQKLGGQATAAKGGPAAWIVIVAFLVLVMGGLGAFATLTVSPPEVSVSINVATSAAATEITPSPEPSLTPTPAFAQAALSFGGSGIGAGLFNDARYIAVDGSGSIYVADYEGGRIQRFDASGKYLSQWRVGDKNTIIYGLTANHQGQVYVSYDDLIERYDGTTGKRVSTLRSPNGGEFGDLYATADGHLAAAWYEGRWGIITSLEGHRDDLVIFDSEDKIVRTIPSIVSAQTGSTALDNYLAVDGTGTIFVLSDGVLYKFSPEGKYINSFDSSNSQSGGFGGGNTLAVDGQGRLYIGDRSTVQVYSPEWRNIDSFPTGVSLDMLAIDAQGVLWGISRDKVTQFTLRP